MALPQTSTAEHDSLGPIGPCETACRWPDGDSRPRVLGVSVLDWDDEYRIDAIGVLFPR